LHIGYFWISYNLEMSHSSLNNQITFLGHSSLEIILGGKKILVDPVFSNQILGFFRREKPFPLDPSLLNQPDLLLLTSTRADHFDIFSYKYFPLTTSIVIPQNGAEKVSRFLSNPLFSLKPDENYTQDGFEVVATTTKSTSFFRWKNSTANYLIKNKNHSIFICSTNYSSQSFNSLSGSIDIALLPLGPTNKVGFDQKTLLSPEELMKVFKKINAKYLIPIHWGGFHSSLERPDEAINQLKALLAKDNELASQVIILEPGMSYPLET